MFDIIKRMKRPSPSPQPTPLQIWVGWAESRIAAVTINEGLFVQRSGPVVRGPMTITFTVRLVRPAPAALRKILALGPTLAQALAVEAVRITDNAHGIRIEVPSPEPVTPTVDFLMEHTAGVNVCIGMDEARRPVRVDLGNYPALMWVGPTRKGKTEGMKSALLALLAQNPTLRVIIVGRLLNWAPFLTVPGVLDVIGDHTLGLAAAHWLNDELERRTNQAQPQGGPLLFIVDDLPFVLKSVPSIATPLGNLAGAGGAVGIYLMVATQFAGSRAGSGGVAMEANILAKVMYRAASNTQAAQSAGRGGVGLDQLSGAKGDAVLILDSSEQRLATAYLPETFWARHRPVGEGARAQNTRPWRQNGAAPRQARGPAAELVEARPAERAERPGTTQNGPERPRTPPVTHGDVAADVGEGITASSTRSARSAALSLTERVELRLASIRSRVPTATSSGPLFTTDHPPTLAEAQAVKSLYQLVGSKEQLYPLVTGPKNGKRSDWLSAALGIKKETLTS